MFNIKMRLISSKLVNILMLYCEFFNLVIK